MRLMSDDVREYTDPEVFVAIALGGILFLEIVLFVILYFVATA